MNLISINTPTTHARAYCSMWIADCVICKSALRIPFGTPFFDCWDCGSRIEVRWPSEEMRAGIERFLGLRPDPNTRNWWPGETLIDLMDENNAHGVGLQAALQGGQDGVLVMTTETQIMADNLPLPAVSRRGAITR
jgi:hypothetical protein